MPFLVVRVQLRAAVRVLSQHMAMLPLNLRPEHYMFLLTVSKDSYAGSPATGARLFKYLRTLHLENEKGHGHRLGRLPLNR
jgi:hypothetical protein